MESVRTRVKICGITRLADGLAAARCGADAVGFVFYAPSRRYLEPAAAAAIAAALPPFVARVGLFVDPDPAWVEATLAAVELDLLQFHGAEPPELCRRFRMPYLKAAGMADNAVDLAALCRRYGDARALLVDSHSGGGGGSGETFAWSRLPSGLPKPLLLAGGLNPANVAAAIAQVHPFGVDVSSGVEVAKGEKSPQLLAAFMAAVQRQDAALTDG